MENQQLLIEYLRKQGSSTNSINSYIQTYHRFQQWAISQQVDPEYTSPADLLDYISYLRRQQLASGTVQGYLNALSHYYEALVKANIIVQNPARYITLQGKNVRTLHAILSRQQLENLYTHFEIKGERKTRPTAYASATRNKIATGLMVFQGLDISALGRLTVRDVNVLGGTIQVRASRTCAARTLALQALQIIEMDRYINQTRKELQHYFQQEESELLLITGYDKYNYANRRLMQRLRRQDPAVKSAEQIRASVITHWLKQYNLREVQYMAGHKHIQSTEHFLRNDTEGLQMEIDRLHPMNGGQGEL